ncbi:MAG TPA: 2-dehydro-3-deoxy-D-gluconate 5-dehydrogenase KduD [Pyrinomonadaceae bacterium]|nr:2-dehydro-3-deoxy-D-gluconate 5-dehydrogenase KduD [Pyrinomonadaceae bacterium]
MHMFDLKGKKALVTGASSGIGRAIALALAEAGAEVACHSRQPGKAQSVIEEIKSKQRVAVEVKGDLSLPDMPLEVYTQAEKFLGRIDILINNAGMIKRSPAVDFPFEDWQNILEVNLNSVFRLTQIAGRKMIENGGGKIVNIASLLSFQGGINVPAYTASKSAIAGLTRALANEWARHNVNVNAIAPGYIETKNTEALRADETRNRQILERIPAGRWGRAEDIAGAAIFLSSSASDYVNGHILVVDGGWMGR